MLGWCARGHVHRQWRATVCLPAGKFGPSPPLPLAALPPRAACATLPLRALAMLWLTSYTTCMSRSSGVDWKILAKACRHRKVMLLRFTHA